LPVGAAASKHTPEITANRTLKKHVDANSRRDAGFI
jgi:hypothetical protein